MSQCTKITFLGNYHYLVTITKYQIVNNQHVPHIVHYLINEQVDSDIGSDEQSNHAMHAFRVYKQRHNQRQNV